MVFSGGVPVPMWVYGVRGGIEWIDGATKLKLGEECLWIHAAEISGTWSKGTLGHFENCIESVATEGSE